MQARFEVLLSLKPGSPKAEVLRARLERELMEVLREKGLRAAMRAVERAGPAGIALATTIAGYREYVWRSEDQGRKLTISVHSTRLFKSTHVLWQQARTRPLTPREQARHARQQAFYEAYNSIAKKAYGPRPPRLGKRDRTILLIGEFEADVNNGGFSQYIDNKGRRRAGEALRALRRIGAERTANLLASALRSPTDGEIERLTARFLRAPDDLASLTAVAAFRS